MNLSVLEIEELVREVLLRLNPPEKSAPSRETKPTELEIQDQVVTTQQLTQIPEQAIVRISPSAVVTPAARDLAAERNIDLTKSNAPHIEGRAVMVITVGAAAQRLAPLLENELTVGQLLARDRTVDAVATAVARLQQQVPEDNAARCLLLTEDVDVAACLANRASHVRAVAVRSTHQLDNALARMAPNLLVVDPTNVREGVHWCRTFVRASARDLCPELQQALGRTEST